MPKETSPIVIVDGNVLNPHLSFILCVQMFYYVLCTNKCIQISTIRSPPKKKRKLTDLTQLNIKENQMTLYPSASVLIWSLYDVM